MFSKMRQAKLDAVNKGAVMFYGATVNLTIKEGAGLLAKDKSFFNSKGKSDPYVKILSEFMDGKKKKTTEMGKTKTKKRSLSPIWDESFTLKLTNHHTPILTFRLYDYDVGSANDEMGQVKLDLLKDLKENTIMDKWHKIVPSPDCMDATGSLSISVSYSLDLPPKAIGPINDSAIKDFRGGKISLKIVKANGLKAMDSSMLSKKGSSDPYCKIFVKDDATGKKSEVGKTKIIKKRLDPTWNETFEFLLSRTFAPIIIIEIFDYDMMSGDDPMGMLQIPISKFQSLQEEPSTFAVQAMEGCENVTGTITFEMIFAQNPPDKHAGKQFGGGLVMGVVERADDLLAVDKNVLSKNSSDSFVIVKTNHKVGKKTKEDIILQTKHKKGTLSPKYDEKFCFDLTPFHDPNIEFAIFDHDMMSSPDPMGHVVISAFDMVVMEKNEDGEEMLVQYDSENIPYIVKKCEILPVPGCVSPKGTLTLKLIFYPLRLDSGRGFFGGDVRIKINNAENLLAMDSGIFSKNATTSDPYIVVCCPEGENFRDNKVAKTKTKKKTLSPIWDEHFSLILDEDSYPYLMLRFYDSDAVSGDDPMGKAVVNLYDFQEGNDMMEVWLQVQPCTGCVTASGRVNVGIEWSRTMTPRFQEFHGGMLVIKILEAKNLLVMDKKGMFSSGGSDPYVKLEGYKKGKGWAVLSKGKNKSKLETFDKTKIIKKSVDPVWNQRLKAALTPQHLPVVVCGIWDHDDLGGDDPMGIVKLNLHDYEHEDGVVEMWANIMSCKGCPSPTGQLKVSFTWAPELSAEKKKRRAEEARRRLYEKTQQAHRDCTMDFMMEEAEKRVKELKEKKLGDYLRETLQKEDSELVEKKLKGFSLILEEKGLKAEDVFQKMDPKRKGKAKRWRFVEVLESFDFFLTPHEMRAFMDHFDEDGNGAIELEEFKGMLEKMEFVKAPNQEKEKQEKKKEGGGAKVYLRELIEGESELEKVMDVYDDVSQFYELSREAEKLALPLEKRDTMFLDDEGFAQQFLAPGADTKSELEGLASLFGGGGGRDGRRKGGFAGLMGASKGGGEKKEGLAGLLGTAPNGGKEKKGLAGLLGAPQEVGGVIASCEKSAILPLSNQKAAAKAALSNPLFAKKKLDASKFVGAGSLMAAGEVTRVKTPMVTVKRLVTQKTNDPVFLDKKQQYEKLIKGVEARFNKRGKKMVTVRTVERVLPRDANHHLNILNAAARDEPVKYLSEDLEAAAKRFHAETNIYASHFTKFKPLFAHPLPTSRPRFDNERMMKKLNNMPRHERAAAAASWGLSWCIEELYMQGCPVNSVNSTGFTPLHIACRFDFVDCVEVLLNIGLEKSSGININAETTSFLTPLAVAISSNAVKCSAYVAARGGIKAIPRPLEGYRSVIDADHTTKFPWLPKMGEQPQDNKLPRVSRAIDDKAKNLGVSVELL